MSVFTYLPDEVDSCLINYTPDIMQGDHVFCVFMCVCYFSTVVACFPGKAERKLRRTFIFTPQHDLCMPPDPHCEPRV